MKFHFRPNLFLVFIILSIIVLAVPVFSQSNGRIMGTITDAETGATLPGANVMVVGTYLGAAADKDGNFTLVNVPVGSYDVQVSMMGYKKVTKTGVFVSVDRISRVDFNLTTMVVAGEEVVIVADRDILHKEVSSSQIVIDNQQIVEAAGVRTLQGFLSNQASITNDEYLNIRGGLASETGTVVNGLTFVNARMGKAESMIPTSAVEQVSLNAGGMSAEYGDFRSGIINVTTKTGSKDGYHGSFSFSRSPAHMKRFGKSLYDPNNNLLRSHLDPDIAFIGVKEAVNQGYITEYDKQQFYNNSSGRGNIFYSDRGIPPGWKSALEPDEVITAVDLYLYDAWMHMANPNWDKLNAKIRELSNSDALSDEEKARLGSEVTDESLKKAFENHQNKEGQYADFNFDGGFGGPVPLIGHMLGDATFFLSNITNRTSYIQPMDLNYDIRTHTMLAIKSNITKAISLKLTAAYSYEKGLSPARGADDELPTLGNDIGTGNTQTGGGVDKGVMMAENNIPLFTRQGGGWNYQYWWYPTVVSPYEQRNLLIGANISHALSAKTFYEFSVSYQRTKDFIDPSLSKSRSNDVAAMFGPIPVTEMPYGRFILPINASSFEIDGVA
ncbi:carboxypeptidase regulatory-like domain-containing protein, partial [bacterium]